MSWRTKTNSKKMGKSIIIFIAFCMMITMVTPVSAAGPQAYTPDHKPANDETETGIYIQGGYYYIPDYEGNTGLYYAIPASGYEGQEEPSIDDGYLTMTIERLDDEGYVRWSKTLGAWIIRNHRRDSIYYPGVSIPCYSYSSIGKVRFMGEDIEKTMYAGEEEEPLGTDGGRNVVRLRAGNEERFTLHYEYFWIPEIGAWHSVVTDKDTGTQFNSLVYPAGGSRGLKTTYTAPMR